MECCFLVAVTWLSSFFLWGAAALKKYPPLSKTRYLFGQHVCRFVSRGLNHRNIRFGLLFIQPVAGGVRNIRLETPYSRLQLDLAHGLSKASVKLGFNGQRLTKADPLAGPAASYGLWVAQKQELRPDKRMRHIGAEARVGTQKLLWQKPRPGSKEALQISGWLLLFFPPSIHSLFLWLQHSDSIRPTPPSLFYVWFQRSRLFPTVQGEVGLSQSLHSIPQPLGLVQGWVQDPNKANQGPMTLNSRMTIWVDGKVDSVSLAGPKTQKDVRAESGATILLACVLSIW